MQTLVPQHLSDEIITIETSPRGKKLRKPITVRLPKAERPGEKAVLEYVIEAFTVKMPSLISLTFENKSLLNLATYLLRHTTGSKATLYQYIYGVHRFCNWISQTPDELVEGCRTPEGLVDQPSLEILTKHLDDFIGDLQAEGLANGTISNHVKGVKALFRTNGLVLNLPYKLSKRVVYRDRSPSPEELQRLIDIADIREKAIISILALSGVRVGTLVKLQYRHVMKDLERGVFPIHVHVEAPITKGKYHDYDTFLGQEAANFLETYIEARRRGSRDARMPPETLIPEAPLIRNAHSSTVKTITAAQVHRILNQLYKKVGLIKKGSSRRYQLRAHSLRKYFRTQLASLGTVPTDYIEYMMGHTISTYHDIQMKGVEFLRNVYASSGLSIRPKTQLNKIEMLKALAMSLGLEPDKVLSKEALSKPHRTLIDPQSQEDDQINVLTIAIKNTILNELKTSLHEYNS